MLCSSYKLNLFYLLFPTQCHSLPVISVIAEKYKHEPRNWECEKRGGKREGDERGEGKEGRTEGEGEGEEHKKFGGAEGKKDNQNFCILSLNYL